ncbi:hypothetical protein [Halobellus sp. GM3]|uniref:hypothetical protein n=1 Tax=Halobellus sp. GM3 TaxID=3458410 RepID=UPI00403DA63F
MSATPGANTPILGNLTYILFLVIPGYVTLRSYRYWSISIDSMNRLDKLATILLGGFISLVSVVSLYRFGIPLTSYLSDSALGIFQSPIHSPTYSPKDPISIGSASDLTVINSAIIILVQSVVGTVIGAFYGNYHQEVDPDPESREELFQPWERAYEISEIGDSVHIITVQNREITGKIQQMGSPSENFDILIAEPHEIIRDDVGEVVRSMELGQFSYHHYRDISRIEFGDPESSDIYDPDGQTSGINSIGEFALRRTLAGHRTLKSFGSGFRRNTTLSGSFIRGKSNRYHQQLVDSARESRKNFHNSILALALDPREGPKEPPGDSGAAEEISEGDDLSFEIEVDEEPEIDD